MADKIFNKFKAGLAAKTMDWNVDPIVVALFDSTSTLVPADTHNFVSDVIALNGGVELVATGYARTVLTGKSTARDDATLHGMKFLAGNVTYTSVQTGKTIKAILVYKRVGPDDTTPADDELIAYLDSAGALPTNGGNITLTWGANGVLTLA